MKRQQLWTDLDISERQVQLGVDLIIIVINPQRFHLFLHQRLKIVFDVIIPVCNRILSMAILYLTIC